MKWQEQNNNRNYKMLHQRNKTKPCNIDTEQIVVSGDGARRRSVETGDVCGVGEC